MRRFDGLYRVIQNPFVRKRARLIGVISGFLAVVFGTMAGFGFPRAVFGANVSISGTVYQTNETSVLATGPTVRAKVNGAGDYSTAAAAGGTYTISNVTVVAGDVITVYLDLSTEKAATYTVGTGSDMTGIDLYQDRLATRCDNSCSLTNTNINQWDKDNDTDIHATATGSPVALTVDNDWKLRVSANTFAPGGSVTMSTGGVNSYSGDVSIAASSTLNMAGNALSISGSYSNSGTFTSGSNTTTLTATSSETLGGTMTSTSAFYNLTQNGSGGTYSLSAAITIDNDLTITLGTLDSNSTSNYATIVGDDVSIANSASAIWLARASTITVSGDWNKGTSGVFTRATSTVNLDGDGSILTSNTQFYNLTVAASGKTTTLATSRADAFNVLTVGSGTLTCSVTCEIYLFKTGSGALVLNASATLSGSAATVIYRMLSATTSTITAGTNYGTWSINMYANTASAVTFNLGGDITTTGSVSVRADVGNAGTTFNTQNYTVIAAQFFQGNSTNSATTTANLGSSTVTLSNNSSTAFFPSLNGGSHNTNLQTSSISVVGGVIFVNGTGTMTIDAGTSTFTFAPPVSTALTYAPNSQSLYNVILNGAGGITPNAAMVVTNDLTMTAGTLSGTQNVTVNGHVAGTAGIINLTGGTFTQRVASAKNFGTTSGSTAWTFSSLTFSNSSGSSATITTQGGTGGITISGTLLIGASGDTGATVLDAGTRTWTLSGTGGDPFQLLASPAGALTASTSTFTYTGANASGNTTIQVATYCNLSVGGSSADTYVLEGATTTSNAASCGDLTIASPSGLGNNTLDTVSGSNYGLTIGGNYANNSVFTAQSGTVTFNATDTGNTLGGTLSGTSAFYNLTFNGAGGSWTLGANTDVTNVLALTNGTLDASSYTVTLSGTTGTPFTTGGTFTPNTSTVAYTGNNAGGNTTVASVTYYNLTLNNASETYTLGTTTTASNNLTITAGTLDVTAANYELRVGGTFSNSDGFTARSGKVILNGTSQTIAGSTTFYDLEKITGSATLTFTAGTTQTIGHQTTLKGTGAGALLSLRSSSSGTQWRFDPQGERDINFVDVQDSYNINAAHITTAYFTIVNSGNNTGWDFGSTGSGGDSGTRAPSNLTGEGLSTSSITWRWSDNSTNETGFKVKNISDETVCTVSSADVTSCTETGLSPNTSYSRYVVATTTGGQTGGSGVASASTLSTGLSASTVTSDKSTQTWYRKGSTHSGLRETGDEFTFTNSAGFSAGGGVDYFRYAFEPSSTHTWSGTESKWSSGTLTTTATHTSDAWYLHLKGYNAQGLENGTLTLGPYYYDNSAPTLNLEKIGTLIFNKYAARTTTTEQKPTFTGKLSEQGTIKLLIEKQGFTKLGLGYGTYITATITTDENGNFSWTPTLEPGTYRVTLVGADRAGNESDALKFNLRILLSEEAGIQEPAEEELAPSPTPVTGATEPEVEETATIKPISLIKPPNLFWKYFFESLGEEWDSLTYPIKLAGFTIGKLAQQALAALSSQLQLAFSRFGVDFSFDQRLGGFEPWYAVEFSQRLGGFPPLRDVFSTAMLPIATQYPQSVDRLLAIFSPVTNWTSTVARKAASGVQSVSNSVGSVVLKVGEQAQTVSDQVGFKIVEFGYRFVDERTIITDVEIAVLSSTSAKITWKTNHPATSKINYGTSTTYTEEAQSSRRVSEHEFLLENLAPNTQYFFEVMSQNKNYVYDANRAFKTPPQ